MAAIDYDTYELPKDIITMIKTTVAQIGPVEFVKHMLFFYLSDNGAHDSSVWNLVAEASEGSLQSDDYINRVDARTREYADLTYYGDGFSPEELAEINAYVDTRDSLLAALSFPLEKVPYITCENLYCLKWGFDKIREGITHMGVVQ